MNRPQTSALFETDHMYLAAFLVCRGHVLRSVLPGASERFQFGFSDTTELRSAAAEFMAGGLVDARQFSFTVLKLKRGLPRCRQ